MPASKQTGSLLMFSIPQAISPWSISALHNKEPAKVGRIPVLKTDGDFRYCRTCRIILAFYRGEGKVCRCHIRSGGHVKDDDCTGSVAEACCAVGDIEG